MVKAVIFDFFGVIRTDSFQAWMKNHGYTREDEPGKVSRAMDTGEISVDEFYERLRKLTGQSDEELRAEFKSYEVFDEELVAYIPILKESFKIGLLSNSDGPYLRNILNEKDLEKLFDEVVISAEVRMAKPDKEIFELLLGRLGVAPEETLFIDDQEKNTSVAESLGIKTIVYTDFDSLKKELEKVL